MVTVLGLEPALGKSFHQPRDYAGISLESTLLEAARIHHLHLIPSSLVGICILIKCDFQQECKYGD